MPPSVLHTARRHCATSASRQRTIVGLALVPLMALVACAGVLSGCGGGLLTGGPGETAVIATSGVGTFAPDGSYKMSESEHGLDCRRLTGRIQVRTLQIRDRLEAQPPSVFNDVAMLLSPLRGNSGERSRVDIGTQRDVEVLKAYNEKLAEKGCPTFDLGAELQPQPVTHTPRPVPRSAPQTKS